MSVDASPIWSRAFDDPITLPDGRMLRTLADAGHYAAALPEDVQQRTEWQTAAEMLIMAILMNQRPDAAVSPSTPNERRRRTNRY